MQQDGSQAHSLSQFRLMSRNGSIDDPDISEHVPEVNGTDELDVDEGELPALTDSESERRGNVYNA